MAKPSRSAIEAALLERHGRTYAEELGINVAKDEDSPSALFELLCAATLFSARISAEQATKAARAMFDQGWSTARKLATTSWDERVRVLNQHGYARYDERTASMLGDACELLLDRYQGDLRKLREAASRDPNQERKLLKEIKGIGDVGVDIFFREVQVAWEELFPFADRRALEAAKLLGLPGDAGALSRGHDPRTFARLVTGLVRMRLAKDHDAVLEAARSR